jgi:Zn-finger nucleic acid-binding protein
MSLMVAASAESERLCPVDGQKMTKEVAHMLVIDRCSACQGVWLDGGELERIRGGVEEAALRSMAIGFTSPFA